METLKGLSDDEIRACQEKYIAAATAALNESRKALGLPPVFAKQTARQNNQDEHSIEAATSSPNHRQKGRNDDGP